MSLRVWLPLNGNLNNQGASTCNPVQATAPTYVDGKIGKAMSTGAFYLPAAEVAKFYNNDTMSFCFWLYPIGSGSVGTPVLGQSTMTAGDNRMFTIFQYPTPNDLHLSWQNNDQNNATFFSSSDTGFFTASQWTHCAIVYAGTSIKIYKNGSLFKTYSCTKATRTNFSYNVPLPNTSIRYLNDIRIYDHCLSDKEVKEISKGLCLHQPCNNKGFRYINPNLIKNTANGTGWGYSTFDKSTKTFTRSNTTTSELYVSGRADLDNTKTYTLSAEVKTNGQVNSVELFAYDNTVKDIRSKNVGAPTEWTKVFLTFTPSTSYSWSNCNIRFDNNGSKTSGVEAILYVRNIKVEEGSSITPWCPHTADPEYTYMGYNDTREIDTSGYGRHGTLASVFPTIQTGSPRYDCCYYYNGNVNNAHYNTTTELNYTDNFSWSIWVKTNYTGTTAQYIFTVGRADAGGFGYGLSNTSTTACTVRYGSQGQGVPVTGGEWTHLAFTKSGNTIKLYKNGTLYSTNTFSGTAPTYSDGNGVGIGCFHYSSNIYPYYGNISDFRIYATALSDADVKELYSTSASIANNGTLMTYDFNEI